MSSANVARAPHCEAAYEGVDQAPHWLLRDTAWILLGRVPAAGASLPQLLEWTDNTSVMTGPYRRSMKTKVITVSVTALHGNAV